MKKRGFLLIEIVMAILILSFTILYTFELFTTGFLVYRKSSVKTRVTKLAQTQLEILAAQGGPTPSPPPPPATPRPTLAPSGVLPYEQDLYFKYDYTSDNTLLDPILKLNEITMHVTGPYKSWEGNEVPSDYPRWKFRNPGGTLSEFLSKFSTPTLTLTTYLPLPPPASLVEFIDGGAGLSPGGP